MKKKKSELRITLRENVPMFVMLIPFFAFFLLFMVIPILFAVFKSDILRFAVSSDLCRNR